jgi:starvation-inducible DNA-binding protein
MFKTQLAIDGTTRLKICDRLKGRVADGIVVTQAAKHAHWNVRGKNFIALHELFDAIHERVEGFTDLLAERHAQLGGYVDGTSAGAVERSSIHGYPEKVEREEDHLVALARALAEFDALIRTDIEKTVSIGDPITADLLTEISRGLEKDLWFLESHLEEATGARSSPKKSTGRPAWARKNGGKETTATL